jgi:membrane protein implicated in regulation of membrane protease activity
MIEFLTNDLLWWHWVTFGLVLVVSEILVPLFVVIWFGLSAIVVGLIDLSLDTTFAVELSIWIILSILFLALWFSFFKNKDIEKSGQANNKFDTRGIVTEVIKHGHRGKVHFDSPFLGSSEWVASSDHDIEVGEAIKIIEVSGQLIKVKKDK